MSCSARRQVDLDGTLSGERKDEGANLGAKNVRTMRSCVENARCDGVPDGWKHNVCEVSLHPCQFECCQPSVNDLEKDGPGCEDSNCDVENSDEVAVPNLAALLVRLLVPKLMPT